MHTCPTCPNPHSKQPFNHLGVYMDYRMKKTSWRKIFDFKKIEKNIYKTHRKKKPKVIIDNDHMT
jgi:hypothetical protein